MVYLIVFLLCLCADYYKRRKADLRILSIIIIYLILCFGYTTGTDWPTYESFYNSGFENAHFADREPGLGILIIISKWIISDFWLFNGFCKVLYLWALTRLIAVFTNKVWTSVAFTIVLSSMFMIVNCPMRFMLSCAFLFLSIREFLNKRFLLASIFSLIALSFHITIIVPLLFFALGFLSDVFFRLKRILLVIISFGIILLSSSSSVYQFIFTKILSLLGLGIFADSGYAFFNASSVFSIGTLRNALILFFLIYYKEVFRGMKYGKLIFYYAIIFFWLDVILRPIPTAFRLSIFNSEMACVAIAILISDRIVNKVKISAVCRYGVITMFVVLIIKTAYGSYAYYPYTNSIPYIIFGHMDYNERVNYNIREYTRNFGSSGVTQDDTEKGIKIE